MDRHVLTWGIVVLAALLQFGCAATDADTNPDNPADLTPVPSKDDSHGWGANLKGV